MSRYCGDRDPEPILNAAEHWRSTCLEKDGAVFSDASLWTLENLHQIKQYFVGRLDEGEGNFYEKLEVQLAPAPIDLYGSGVCQQCHHHRRIAEPSI